MIETSCHCGAVKIEVAELPTRLTDCNCSICRRVHGLWAYYHQDQVRVICEPGATTGYVQGDGTLANHHCNICGCTTHWISIDPAHPGRMAVNMRMADPAQIAGVQIRKFDGADTWTFFDDEGNPGAA